MRCDKEKTVVPLGAVLCVCACLVGCGQKEDLPSAPAPKPKEPPAATSVVSRAEVRSTTASIEERANDPVYQERLAEFEKDRQRIRKRRAKIESHMARLRAYARKALPSGATEDQVLAELENNPKKYPAWRELVAVRKKNMAEEERTYVAARAAVAQRISRKESGGGAQGAAPADK